MHECVITPTNREREKEIKSQLILGTKHGYLEIYFKLYILEYILELINIF